MSVIIEALTPAVVLIVRAVLEAIFGPDTVVAADRDDALRERLAERVREAKRDTGSAR